MGMFDEFVHPCPDCGANIIWQSKAGDCLLRQYTIADVPTDIAADLQGKTEACPKCHKTLTFSTVLVIQMMP